MPLRLHTSRLGSAVTMGASLGRTTSKSTTYIPPRPPEGAGCSRWISCTCCRKSDHPGASKSAYFSANRGNNISKPQPTFPTIDTEPALSPSNNTRQTARLPLPPTLPYSPNSVPAQRHLQYLSLAVVSSTPEDSWRTYLALHPSLRRYIPDDLFRSLLAHQLLSEHPKQRWIRSLALVKFAKRCGVNARDLGEENLKNVFRAGLTYVLRTKALEIETYTTEIEVLWDQVIQCREVPLDLRKGYLQYHIKRRNGNHVSRRTGRAEMETAEAHGALRDVVERFGLEGIGREAGRIISLYHGPDIGTHVKSLEAAALCAENGQPLPDDTGTVMLRLVEIWRNEGVDSMAKLESIVGSLPVTLPGAEFLDSMLAEIRYRVRRPVQRVVDAIADNSSIPIITRATLDMLGDTNADMGVALDALEDLVKRKAEVDSIVSAIVKRLSSRQDTDSAIRLTSTLFEHDTIVNSRDPTIHSLFHLLLSRIPNEEAYILSRKLYSLARAHNYRWHHLSNWQTLCRHSLARSRRQLHFASRLFADAQADGLKPNLDDYRNLIRAVASSRSASRPILLDRYITSFLELDTSPEPFVLALVQGLTLSRNANDASLALELSRRILQDRPISPAAAELMIGSFAASPRISHLRQAIFLLDSSPSITSFNMVIFSIVAHSRSDPKSGEMSRTEALSHAVRLYKRMMDQDIPANARTVSLLLRALVDSRHISSALAVFNAAVNNGFALKPNSVGRLMVRLIIDERFDEAARIESRWRQSADIPNGNRYDRAVVGARVLLDTKLGKSVDLEEVARKTGWSGTKPFLRFIESLKPRQIPSVSAVPEADAEEDWEAIQSRDRQLEGAENRGEVHSAGDYGFHKATLE
jgi:hypothetical protein